ncbi:MAG: hypothetical protein JW814_06400 [Candidatus Krumholzibacteriota bacterium]|nr:hypothetical protein [Candidatus Krumholzibacteriota bacterium]
MKEKRRNPAGNTKGLFVVTFLLLIAQIVFYGCGDSSGPSTPVDTVIGPEGGTVTDPGGASVIIPAGALASETRITVNTLQEKGDLPEENQIFLPMLGGGEFGPDGTVFAIPVTMTIPVDPPLQPTDKVTVLYWDDTEEGWSRLESIVSVAPDGMSVTFESTHFSIFSAVTDVFDDFHENFGDGSTAEAAFTGYVSWFKANVTDIGRKGLYREDCHEVVGLRIGLSYSVHHLPDGPVYEGIPYHMEGSSTAIEVVFFVAYEFVQAGVLDKNYNLEIHVFLECCQAEVEVSADPSSIGTGQTSRVTATVACDDEAMRGYEVTFESLGGFGTVSPASATTSSGGTAFTTFTAGDDEGVESVRASTTNCGGSESPDGAAQIEINNDWSGDLDITFVHDIGDEPLFTFTDDVSISVNLTIEEGVVTGTGSGTHNISLSIHNRCGEEGMSAPGFSVFASGVVSGDMIEMQIVAMSMPVYFNLHCVWDTEEGDFPYPVYGLLESAIIAQYIFIEVPFEDGGTDSGSGIDPSGEDIPMAYSYSFSLSGS